MFSKLILNHNTPRIADQCLKREKFTSQRARLSGKQTNTIINECKLRVPSGVCIYIPGYVYIPFPEIGYVKGMYLTKKVCKTAFTAMFPGYLKCKLAQNVFECLSTRLFPLKIGPPHPI